MSIAKEDVEAPSRAPVPLRLLVSLIPIAVPRPIRLDQFRGGSEAHFAAFDWPVLLDERVTRDFFSSKIISGPLYKITGSVGLEARADDVRPYLNPALEVQGISPVRGATKAFFGWNVDVEDPVAPPIFVAVVGIHPSPSSSRRRPGGLDRIEIVIVIHVHVVGDALLFLVVQAFNGLCFGLGLRQGGQEHPREDRDDSDDDKKFYQSEREGSSGTGTMPRMKTNFIGDHSG